MSKTIVAAAALLSVLTCGTAHAAGPGGLARSAFISLSQPHELAEVQVAPAAPYETDYQAVEVLNIAVNETIGALDGYFDSLAVDATGTPAAPGLCTDCARIKQEALVARGQPADELRIGFLMTPAGTVERVLIVSTGNGDLVLDNRAPQI
jgi:predicted transglutaminase-like cysteine proteinase